jgi:signal transduction histidine kinase
MLPLKNSAAGLKTTLESILSHGTQHLPERGLRLQLLVFNSALLLSVALTLGFGLILIAFEYYDRVLASTLPFLTLFFIIHLIARQRYFLLARILYVVIALASVAFGVCLHGTRSQLPLFFLDLALLPFLLFRSQEWRWIVTSTLGAFILFLLIEFQVFPPAYQPFPIEMEPFVTLLFASGAFIGVIAPSLLVFWQTHMGFRRALRLSRIKARDEKFSAIGRLAAGAAHEINNPLAIVQLTLENLEHQYEIFREPQVQQRIRRGYDAIQRIHQILQKLLASSLVPGGRPEIWTVTELTQLISQRCRRVLQEQGVSLLIRKSVKPGYRVLCHRQSVMDVVDSLIRNAVDALHDRGQPHVILSLTCDHSFFTVKVEDNGPGVPDEELRSIFTPFFTTKEVGTGLGLSLYSARCIVQQYGGDLTCERGPGGRFSLHLPLVHTESASLQA